MIGSNMYVILSCLDIQAYSIAQSSDEGGTVWFVYAIRRGHEVNMPLRPDKDQIKQLSCTQ